MPIFIVFAGRRNGSLQMHLRMNLITGVFQEGSSAPAVMVISKYATFNIQYNTRTNLVVRYGFAETGTIITI